MTNSRVPVLAELGTLVAEFDAVPKADSDWSVDEALGQLLIRLNGEIRRTRKFHATAQPSPDAFDVKN